MTTEMKRRIRVLMIALSFTVALAAAAGVNSSINIGDNEERDGNVSAVNGSVTVGDGATIRGDLSSVNGGVKVGNNVRVEGVSSVNGGVRIGDDTVVRDGISSVNGDVSVGKNSKAREASTVNGRIKLQGSEIARDLRTVNGDIVLTAGAIVGGNVIIEERRGHDDHRGRPQRIELEDGSEIRGDIIVEDPDLEVEVYVRGGSRIGGRVEGARVIRD